MICSNFLILKTSVIFKVALVSFLLLANGPGASPFAQAAGSASNIPTLDLTSLNKHFEVFEQTRALQKNVQSEAHELATHLCYAFEFRQKHNQHLIYPDPVLEGQLIIQEWPRDAALRKAFRAWLKLDLWAYKAPLGDDAALVSARSLESKYLLESIGFKAAMAACSKRLGRDIEKLMADEITRNERLKSGSVTLLGFGVAFRALTIGFKTASQAKLFQPIQASVGRWKAHYFDSLSSVAKARLKLGGIGLASTAIAGLSAQMYFSKLKENSATIDLLLEESADSTDGASSAGALWAEWSLRRQLLVSILDELKSLYSTGERTGDFSCQAANLKNCEKFEKTLTLFAINNPELQKLTREIELELENHTQSAGFQSLEAWIVEVFATQQTNSASTEVAEKTKFYVAARLVRELLESRERVMPAPR